MRYGRLLVAAQILVAAVALAVSPAIGAPPTITLISDISGIVNSSSATFNFTINRQVRAISRLECTLDGVPTPCYPLSFVDKHTSVSGVRFVDLAVGPHTLTVTAALTDGGHAAASRSWEVSSVLLIGIDISPRNARIAPGDSLQYVATGTYSDGSLADLTDQVRWLSSDPNIASIDQSGLATGGSFQGIAEIVASRWDITSAPALLVVISQ
jgi:hypothetical protein